MNIKKVVGHEIFNFIQGRPGLEGWATELVIKITVQDVV